MALQLETAQKLAEKEAELESASKGAEEAAAKDAELLKKTQDDLIKAAEEAAAEAADVLKKSQDELNLDLASRQEQIEKLTAEKNTLHECFMHAEEEVAECAVIICSLLL